MKLFGLTVLSSAMAQSTGVTQYKDVNGNIITIDPGCPTLWPKNRDSDTVLPNWKKACPPIDLCYPNMRQNVGTSPYTKRCKPDGSPGYSPDCCSIGYSVKSFCYGACETGFASNMDGKTKLSWRCSCSRTKGCWWVVQGTGLNDMICTECDAARRINWTTSGRKQADYNNTPSAAGVNGRVLSAGWIHKNSDNNWYEAGEYYIVLSIQGVTLDESHVMAWDYDVHGVWSEGYGANQWYTFAQTLVVLKPNAFSPQGPWNAGDQTDILIGIENYDDFNQENLDAGRVHYSVGILYNTVDANGNPWDFACALSHFGADPGNNDMALEELIPDSAGTRRNPPMEL